MSSKFGGTRGRRDDDTFAFRPTPYITAVGRPTTSSIASRPFLMSGRPNTTVTRSKKLGGRGPFIPALPLGKQSRTSSAVSEGEWHNTLGGLSEWDGSRATTSGPQGNKGAHSSRSTRKEEFEYLEFILSRSKTSHGAGSMTARGRMQGTSGFATDDVRAGGANEGRGLGMTGRSTRGAPLPVSRGATLPKPDSHRPLPFQRFSSLYDVATWSEFASSQDFAGKGVAALCSIRQDRDLMYTTGAVQYMLDLLLMGRSPPLPACLCARHAMLSTDGAGLYRSPQAKCDACDALVELVKSDEACRSFLSWTGTDPKDGRMYASGLEVVRRFKDAKQPGLQRAGATLLNTVLMSNCMKPTERVEPEKIQCCCAYACASDAAASKRAAKTLVAVIFAVLDTGVRWTESCITPILNLIKDAPPNPRVASFALKAISMICKEGDRVCALLSEVGCVKTLALLLSAREGKVVDMDDVCLVRVITQICEVDSNRFEDAVLLGGVPRMLAILRKHLVAHSILLPHELEVQRRTSRFLEKMVARKGLGKALFESGTCELCLDIMDMERCSCKAAAVNTLAALTTDAHVQSHWHTLPDHPSHRLAHHVGSQEMTVRIKTVEMLGQLCKSQDAAKTMLEVPNLLEHVIGAMEDACKMQERGSQHKLLSATCSFLLRFSQFDFGCQHITSWSVLPRVDPNMRKVRGLLSQQREMDDMWRTYDEFVFNMSQ